MMSGYKEKIQKLSLKTGYSLDINERFLLTSLENSQSDMIAEIETKKELLKYLTEQEEEFQGKLDSQIETESDYIDCLQADVEQAKKGLPVLEKYFSVIQFDPEYPINKLMTEGQAYSKDYHEKLKMLGDKHRSVKSDLEEVKKLHNMCLELVQKANSFIAPAH